MSDDNTFALGKLIPGFDFLQQLTSTTKGASKSAPGLRHWIAPTVSVEELDKRITELRAVQFWLEQNLLALKATIQALEVQKMTLATLRDMNLSVTEVAKAFTLPKSEERAAPAAPPAGGPTRTRAPRPPPRHRLKPLRQPPKPSQPNPPSRRPQPRRAPGPAAKTPPRRPAAWPTRCSGGAR